MHVCVCVCVCVCVRVDACVRACFSTGVGFHKGVRAWACAHPLQEGVAGGLPQLAGQLSAVLEDVLGGDDPQMDGQQLVALHHLPRVGLTVVAEQLPVNTQWLLL